MVVHWMTLPQGKMCYSPLVPLEIVPTLIGTICHAFTPLIRAADLIGILSVRVLALTFKLFPCIVARLHHIIAARGPQQF